MNVTQLFIQTNAAFRGSDDDPPASGTTDFDLWLATANRKLGEWARDGKHTWESLFEVRSIGTVSVNSQNYDLDGDMLLPADKLTVTTIAGQILEYHVCKPQDRGRFTNDVYISGRDPQVLTFNDPITATSQIVGGTINLAGYFIPEDLVRVTDTVWVDDPYWLVYALASELAFNDLTYSDKAPDLNAKANNLYTQMVNNNRRGTADNPRTAPTNVRRIIAPQSERLR